jgi:TldD protein
MSDALGCAQPLFLDPAGLDETALLRVMGAVMGPGVTGGDLYFQQRVTRSWSLEDGLIKAGSHDRERGVGVRAISGDRQGLAYADDIDLPALLEAATAARAIVADGATRAAPQRIQRRSAPPRYRADDPLTDIPTAVQLAVLQRADAAARAADPRVYQVNVRLAAQHETVMVLDAEGQLSADLRPLLRLDVTVMVEQGDRREQAHAGGGGRDHFSVLLADDGLPESVAREAVRQAVVLLDAVPAPAGSLPVVLGPGWPGILLHEAVGHGLEGDFNRKGSSVFSGRVGQQVAAPHCTIVDDGTLAGRRGSLSMDDEGTPTNCTVLIENGVLKGYMQDRLNAGLMGVAPTGNGRRESYAHLPMPRMTNTYMRAGPHDPAEIIASVKKGLYAVNFGGGQVDITSGNFVFSASEAYLIENGKITRPVKGATLIGNGPDTLPRMSMVGTDMALDGGVGICGKDGQSVPVGVGQPTVKVDALTVGGTAA